MQSIQAIRISDVASCETCRIAFREVISLRPPLPKRDGYPLAVRTDQRHRLWLVRRGELPVLFDSIGTFIQLVDGLKVGENSISHVTDVVAVGRDTVVLVEAFAFRATVLGANLERIGTWALPMTVQNPTVISWPTNVVASGNLPTTEAVGLPLHQFALSSRELSLVRSFSSDDGDVVPDWSVLSMHHFTTPKANGYWSAWVNGYDLTLWDSTNKVRQRLVRRPSWFSVPSPPNYDWRNRPPPPHIAAIEQDDEGLLWVYLRTASPQWRSAWPAVDRSILEVPARAIKMERLFRTTVEVIDPRRRRLVKSHVVDAYVINALPNGRAAFLDMLQDGSARIRVMSFRLEHVR
jgi:hypothetical protein